MQLWARTARWLQSLWSTQPSTLRWTVNEYQPYGWVIIHGDGRMFGLQQPTGGLKGQVCSVVFRVGGHLALTDFHSEDLSELSHVALRRWWQHCKYRRGIVVAIISLIYHPIVLSFLWAVWRTCSVKPGPAPEMILSLCKVTMRGEANGGLWLFGRIRIRIALATEHFDAAPAVLIFTTSLCPSLITAVPACCLAMTLSPSFVSHNQAVWAWAAGTD